MSFKKILKSKITPIALVALGLTSCQEEAIEEKTYKHHGCTASNAAAWTFINYNGYTNETKMKDMNASIRIFDVCEKSANQIIGSDDYYEVFNHWFYLELDLSTSDSVTAKRFFPGYNGNMTVSQVIKIAKAASDNEYMDVTYETPHPEHFFEKKDWGKQQLFPNQIKKVVSEHNVVIANMIAEKNRSK